jgi:hypothetical protein
MRPQAPGRTPSTPRFTRCGAVTRTRRRAAPRRRLYSIPGAPAQRFPSPSLLPGDEAVVARCPIVPTFTFVPRTAPRATNAFLIQVRGADGGPSSGDSVSGIISLAHAHLQGHG